MTKIKRIKQLKDFGVFSNFSWDSNTDDFKSRNIIYGWNYSGKTTLSRLFESLSSSTSIYDEIPDVKISIESCGNTINITSDKINVPIYVFNNDYVDRNLHFHTTNNPKFKGLLFDIGDTSSNKRSELNFTKEQISEIENWLATNVDAIEKFSALDKKISLAAKNIKNDVFESSIEFTRKHFYKEMSIITSSNLNKFLITSPSELSEIRYNALQKSPMNSVSFALIDINLEELVKLTNRYINFSPSIAKEEKLLDSNSIINSACKDLTSFYNDNKNIRVCAFCGNPISEKRISELNAYYTNESSKLRENIELATTQFDNILNSIKSNLVNIPSANDLLESCREQFITLKVQYVDFLHQFERIIILLKESLIAKLRNSMFVKMPPIIVDLNFVNEFSVVASSLNTVINQHNSTIQNFEMVKKDASQRLKLHYIAKTLKEYDYFKLKSAKEKLENERNNKAAELSRLKDCVRAILAELTSIAKGQERLNFYIQLFLSRKDLLIKTTEDNFFVLYRGDSIAINLSEGEKTAIAFAYFLVFLENIKEQGSLKESIIFIDDPISSLDNNHIAQISSLINSFFFYINKENGSERVCENFAQLFITTHNFEFFSFLRDANNIKRKQGSNFYLIKRTTETDVELINLPKTFSNYNSEYLYLFSEIFKYYNSNCPEDGSYTLPNVIRRFLEIYTRIKLPGNNGEIDSRLKILTSGKTTELKLLHYFSHFTELERVTKHSELILRLPEIVSEVIEFLKQDKVHYESLLSGINRT